MVTELLSTLGTQSLLAQQTSLDDLNVILGKDVKMVCFQFATEVDLFNVMKQLSMMMLLLFVMTMSPLITLHVTQS